MTRGNREAGRFQPVEKELVMIEDPLITECKGPSGDNEPLGKIQAPHIDRDTLNLIRRRLEEETGTKRDPAP